MSILRGLICIYEEYRTMKEGNDIMKRNLAKKFYLLFCFALSLTLLSGFSYNVGNAVESPALSMEGRYDLKTMHLQDMSPSDQGGAIHTGKGRPAEGRDGDIRLFPD